ncbi:O-antigen translocase [Mariniflexile sp.]|uniref:O-antigen translocase n=1 Tax=Mariniflexile sp. TaxID=1979402 RepID=UPI0040478754
MLHRIKQVYKNSFLIKVASFNILSVFVKLVSGFIVSKTMAIFIGPSGIAISGNLSNFTQSLESLSSLGIKNGTIKYVAESKSKDLQFKRVISSSFFFSISIAVLASSLLFVFSNSLSALVFNKVEFSFLFRISGLMMPFYSIHIFFISIINGLKKFKELVRINVVGYILITLLMVVFIYAKQLNGALLAIAITPFLLFTSLFYQFNILKFIVFNIKLSCVSKEVIKKLASFFSMTLFSGIMIPIIYLLIRSYIINNVGANEAGYWEGTRKISNYYMLFIYTLFDIYLLPVLSEDTKSTKFKSIIFNFYKNILPLVLLGFIVIYFFKIFIIKLIFTDDFLGMQELFGWQLIGDFFKIVSFTIAYQFLAKKMIRLYLICEISYMIFIYFTSIYLINYMGVLGAVKAHAFSYLFYTLLVFFIFRNELFKKNVV